MNINAEGSFGIYVDNGDIKIADGANVTITPGKDKTGIGATGSVTISDGAIVTMKEDGNGTRLGYGISAYERLTIENSKVDIEVSNLGIYGYDDVSLSDSNVTVDTTSTEFAALRSYTGISITGGETELTSGKEAIFADSAPAITNATPIYEGADKTAALAAGAVTSLTNTGWGMFTSKPYVSIGITPASVCIWGKGLTSSTPYYHNGTNGAKGTVNNTATGANASYDPTTGVLTLSDLSATNSTATVVHMSDAPIYYGYAIYAAEDITINLTGNSTASVTGANHNNAAVYVEGDLTILGNGSLAASCDDSAWWSGYGVLAYGEISVSGGTLTASTTDTESAALYPALTLGAGMQAQGSTDSDGSTPLIWLSLCLLGAMGLMLLARRRRRA